MPKDVAGPLSELTAVFSLNIDSFGLPLQCVSFSFFSACSSSGAGTYM